MIILFKEDKLLMNDINNLLQESSILHKNVYEKDLYKIFRKYPDAHVEPEVNIYNPRKGWGWTWSSIRYFASFDEFSAYLPQANKIDKDSMDEIRSEDFWFKSNKMDILQSMDVLEAAINRKSYDDILQEFNKLKELINKGE